MNQDRVENLIANVWALDLPLEEAKSLLEETYNQEFSLNLIKKVYQDWDRRLAEDMTKQASRV